MTPEEIYRKRRYQHGVNVAPALKTLLRENPNRVISETHEVLDELISQREDGALIFELIATGDLELVKLFVEAGGDHTDIAGDYGTPLDFAMYLGYVEIFDYLYPLLRDELDITTSIQVCWDNDYFFEKMLPHIILSEPARRRMKGIAFLTALGRFDRIDAIIQQHGVNIVLHYDEVIFTALKYNRNLDFFTQHGIRPSEKFLPVYEKWLSEDEIQIVRSYLQ